MENKVCTFFGHRTIDNQCDLKEKVSIMIDKLIDNNYRVFIFGGFGEFDELCHTIVSQKKEAYPDIKRVYSLTDEKHLNTNKRPKYLQVCL